MTVCRSAPPIGGQRQGVLKEDNRQKNIRTWRNHFFIVFMPDIAAGVARGFASAGGIYFWRPHPAVPARR